MKALLKLGKVDEAVQMKENFKSKLTPKQLEKIERQIIYANGRKNIYDSDFNEAGEQFKALTKQKKSSSACYNLASTLYSEEKWEEAEKWI